MDITYFYHPSMALSCRAFHMATTAPLLNPAHEIMLCLCAENGLEWGCSQSVVWIRAEIFFCVLSPQAILIHLFQVEQSGRTSKQWITRKSHYGLAHPNEQPFIQQGRVYLVQAGTVMHFNTNWCIVTTHAYGQVKHKSCTIHCLQLTPIVNAILSIACDTDIYP